MNRAAHVARPPAKPLMLFDGDCKFCTLWIHRWQLATGEFVEYLPFQQSSVAGQFPEIPREQFENAVQLILPDGSVFSAAEAVFRSLACNPKEQWLIDLHEHSPVFRMVSESGYRFVARHRTLFSWLTRLLWGEHLEPPSHNLVRWIFLRGLGAIYLIAFLSLWSQISGLVGEHGIVPAKAAVAMVKQRFDQEGVGIDRYHRLPTFCWFSASDRFLSAQCAIGTAAAMLVIFGFAQAPCLFLLWLIYLSLSSIGADFMDFQWDALLLEAGFLAIFFAPGQLFPRRASQEAPPSQIVLWLLRWLIFRLMFESGLVKLLSGDPAWRHLTALNFHYETQPLPTWIGWYAHQLPSKFQTTSVAVMFLIELAVPFLIFAPRRPRHFAAAAFIFLQVLILLTGNYCFFNLLTILLCVPMLDDAALRKFVPVRAKFFAGTEPAQTGLAKRHRPFLVPFALAALVACASYAQVFGFLGIHMPGPPPVITLYQWLQPLRSFNSYGLFAMMTTERREIVVEGSNDGVNWKAYEFKYKPGALDHRPGFVAPHQPRLDWQMWFAALGNSPQNPWFVNFCAGLLEGSPEILELLENNPFPDAPPLFVRAEIFEYHFTDFAARRKTGEWWRRELKGLYLPPISRATDAGATNRRP